jgi:MFS transporter, DHA1 family, inner membrane transport protein
VWGLGFASTNSMQQVRLVAAAPPLAPASVSLNTSVLYIGQAVGSATGGLLFARDLIYSVGYASMAFLAGALAMVLLSRPRPTSRA